MPLRNQPRGRAQINRSHPWARYIKGAWVFNRPDFRNIADPVGPAATRNGTLPLQAYPGGLCVSGASGGRIDTPYTATQLGINGARKRTILFEYLHPAGYGGPATILSLGGTNSGGNEFCVRIVNANQIQLGGFYADSQFNATPGGVDHVVQIALTYDGSTLYCYAIATGSDGVTRYSSSNGTNLSTSDDHPLSFLNTTFDHIDQFTSQLRSVVILSDYAASNAEVERYFSNTNAIFDAGSSSSTYQSAIAASPSVAQTSTTAAVSWAEANDTSTAAGVVTDRAAAAWTEADEAHAIAAAETNRAAAAWTEADETQALASTETNRAAVVWTEGSDSAQLAGSVLPNQSSGASGAIAWTEAGDSVSAAAQLLDRGAAAWAEQDEAAALVGHANTPPAISLAVRFNILPRSFGETITHFTN